MELPISSPRITPFSIGGEAVRSFKLTVVFKDSCLLERKVIPDKERRLRAATKVTRWKRIREIGRGCFGAVHLWEDREGNARAIKEISKDICKQSAIDPLRELTAMADCSKVHPQQEACEAFLLAYERSACLLT